MREGRSLHLLAFVEDPGATNCLLAVLPEFVAGGGTATVLADGLAAGMCASAGIRSAPSVGVSVGAFAAGAGPKALLVGTAENRDSAAHRLVAEARAAGIPSVGIVDAPMNAALRFRGPGDGPLDYAPDWLLVPDEWTREAYVGLGFPASRAMALGHPHLDRIAERVARILPRRLELRRQWLGAAADAGQPVILFAAENDNVLQDGAGVSAHAWTLRGSGTRRGRTDVAIEEFLVAVAEAAPRAVTALRPHPKNRPGDFEWCEGRFTRVSREGDPIEWVCAADIVVGLTSMLIVEAAVAGRPTLSILPDATEREWLISVRNGWTRCASTPPDVKRELAALCRCVERGEPSGVPVAAGGANRRIAGFLFDRFGAGGVQ